MILAVKFLSVEKNFTNGVCAVCHFLQDLFFYYRLDDKHHPILPFNSSTPFLSYFFGRNVFARELKAQNILWPLSKEECRYWLLDTCSFGSRCHGLHDPSRRGIRRREALRSSKENKNIQEPRCSKELMRNQEDRRNSTSKDQDFLDSFASRVSQGSSRAARLSCQSWPQLLQLPCPSWPRFPSSSWPRLPSPASPATPCGGGRSRWWWTAPCS